MKTKVTPDYVEVALTGQPSNSASAYKNHNSVLENLYTGTVLDAPAGSLVSVGQVIVFAKVFKIIVDANETKHYVHKNAIVSIVTE